MPQGAQERLLKLPGFIDRLGLASEAFGYQGDVEPWQVQAGTLSDIPLEAAP